MTNGVATTFAYEGNSQPLSLRGSRSDNSLSIEEDNLCGESARILECQRNTARKIAVYFYNLLTKGLAFVEEGIKRYEKRKCKRRKLKRKSKVIQIEPIITKTTTTITIIIRRIIGRIIIS